MKCENCEFFNNALLLCKEKSKIYTKDKKYSCDYYNILKKKVYATLGKERLVLDFSRIVYLYYNIDDTEIDLHINMESDKGELRFSWPISNRKFACIEIMKLYKKFNLKNIKKFVMIDTSKCSSTNF